MIGVDLRESDEEMWSGKVCCTNMTRIQSTDFEILSLNGWVSTGGSVGKA